MSTFRTVLAALLLVLAVVPGTTLAADPPKVLTQAQQLTAADGVLAAANALTKRLGTLKTAAVAKKDTTLAACYEVRATKLTPLAASVATHVDALKVETDAAVRQHKMDLLDTLAGQIKGIAKEADMCVGDAIYEPGTTSVVTEVDAALVPWVNAVGQPPASFLDTKGTKLNTPDLTSIPSKTKPGKPATPMM